MIDLSRHTLPAPPVETLFPPTAGPSTANSSRNSRSARAGAARAEEDFALSPFTVIQDTREQTPWRFDSLRENADAAGRKLVVPVLVDTLASGDYSIAGHESDVSIERKSKEDLHSTLTWGRARFERELDRLNQMHFSAVVVESDWRGVLEIPVGSKVRAKAIYFSLVTLPQRFPRVHWFLMPSRREAEATCYWLLERWWRDRQE